MPTPWRGRPARASFPAFNLRSSAFICGALLLSSLTATAAPVTLTETPDTYTLSNGTVTAVVDKRTGGLPSLTYDNLSLLNQTNGRDAGYWSHSANSDRMEKRVTIDPKSNNGDAAEVSIKGYADGHRMGSGPGGSTVCDIEIRYALLRDTPGLYTYSTFSHPKDYPATGIGEARFLLKLNDDVFDWMTVDAQRDLKMLTTHDWNYGIPLTMKEVRFLTTGEYKGRVEHKYDYSANQFQTPAWGWSSTTKHVGIWFINPTIEYLSGGPTKIELSAHRDATFNPDAKTAPAPPCLLNYWRGSHYGGTNCTIADGETWSKTIGPFLIYCNHAPTPDAAWKDALARVPTEQKAWPYAWAHSPDYPLKDDRAMVTGHLVLNDPQLTTNNQRLTNLLVGLTHPDYPSRGFRGNPQTVDWQNDAKFYQFWTRANPDGTFEIPNVRPGTYTLHAFSSNILGEYTKTNITVDPASPDAISPSPGTPGEGRGEGRSAQHEDRAQKTLALGDLPWTPKRFGKTLWEIGTPDRSAAEFLHGDHANQWGLYFQYPLDFPHDVHYVIGQSDYRKDWNLMQVPHATLPENFHLPPSTTTPPPIPASSLSDQPPTFPKTGQATPWTITFPIGTAPKSGTATLRLAFAGTEARSLAISVNGHDLPPLTNFPNTSSIHRDSNTSYWQQRDVPFPADLLKQGDNTLTLTVPPGNPTAGVMYDYLRLELDESARQ